MDRRNFFKLSLGTAATLALPSEVWPFRKIFIPSAPKMGWFANLATAEFGYAAVDYRLEWAEGIGMWVASAVTPLELQVPRA